jgi:hypothetical protein
MWEAGSGSYRIVLQVGWGVWEMLEFQATLVHHLKRPSGVRGKEFYGETLLDCWE